MVVQQFGLYRVVNADIHRYKDQLVSAIWKQVVRDLTVTPSRDMRYGQNVFLSVKKGGTYAYHCD